MTQILSLLLSRIRQPRVIAEVIGGVILGPSIMGRIPGFKQAIFPDESMDGLTLTANIGLVLFLFLVGLVAFVIGVDDLGRLDLLYVCALLDLPELVREASATCTSSVMLRRAGNGESFASMGTNVSSGKTSANVRPSAGASAPDSNAFFRSSSGRECSKLKSSSFAREGGE